MMFNKIKRYGMIQAAIFVVLAFGIPIPIFPDSSITLKLFMFFMRIGCGVSLSGNLIIQKRKK